MTFFQLFNSIFSICDFAIHQKKMKCPKFEPGLKLELWLAMILSYGTLRTSASNFGHYIVF